MLAWFVIEVALHARISGAVAGYICLLPLSVTYVPSKAAVASYIHMCLRLNPKQVAESLGASKKVKENRRTS